MIDFMGLIRQFAPMAKLFSKERLEKILIKLVHEHIQEIFNEVQKL